MNRERLLNRLRGCYVTVPTLFHDGDLSLNLSGIERHVEFLLSGGIREGNGILLAGGAAGDFSTMTIAERLQVAETVIGAAAGKLPIAVGRANDEYARVARAVARRTAPRRRLHSSFAAVLLLAY